MEALRLARSQKLQEHVWEQSGTLASATSPGCLLQGPMTWKLNLCHGCASDQCGQKHCFWGHRSGIAGSADWKCNGPLPLVVLALEDQRKLSSGLCFNSLDILFVECVEMNWRIGPDSLRTKSLFLAGWPFCSHICWQDDTQKGHLGCFSSLYDSPFLL